MSEYRGNFKEAEAVIILTDVNIRHSLNSSPVHEPDEYPGGIELQIRTLLRRSFSFFKRVLAFGGKRSSTQGCLIMLLNFRYRAMEGAAWNASV